jgi:hypothetical protein
LKCLEFLSSKAASSVGLIALPLFLPLWFTYLISDCAAFTFLGSSSFFSIPRLEDRLSLMFE